LQTIPGIGRKTAERVVLELKEKMDRVTLAAAVLNPEVTTDGVVHLVGDVVSALLNLGYKRLEAE
jgi:Holliday junction DNA helicase RuvA